MGSSGARKMGASKGLLNPVDLTIKERFLAHFQGMTQENLRALISDQDDQLEQIRKGLQQFLVNAGAAKELQRLISGSNQLGTLIGDKGMSLEMKLKDLIPIVSRYFKIQDAQAPELLNELILKA